MKVLIADPTSPQAIEEMKSAGVDVQDLSGVPKEELPEKVKDFDVMVVRSATKVRKEMIDKMEQMKLIVRGGVGLDNIDVDYATTKGIKVTNTPLASSSSVAEITLAHMFALSRHIARGTQSIKEGKWEKKILKGIELSGKTLGIIGIGRIGKKLAKKATALGMNVVGYDPYVKNVEGVESVDFDTLLNTSDYISLHIPFTPETKHLIGKNEFEKMKDGVIIINCARGGVVDEQALLEALKSGKVGGAGLDVFKTEPPPKTELMELPNVTFTPHIGAATKEAQSRIGKEVSKIVCEFAKTS
ncbi:D-2-hydroxyacid dehydrogenase [candidate division WOR-3 bacterium]|nr:D-2-hydroxyacid dehydrogenase [candidate division WOR-3 bacterium]